MRFEPLDEPELEERDGGNDGDDRRDETEDDKRRERERLLAVGRVALVDRPFLVADLLAKRNATRAERRVSIAETERVDRTCRETWNSMSVCLLWINSRRFSSSSSKVMVSHSYW